MMDKNEEMKQFCYADSVLAFKQISEKKWLNLMTKNFKVVYPKFKLTKDQCTAWRDCFRVMQMALANTSHPENTTIIFEYKLPYEGGRRPDVILLSSSKIYLLEFKMSDHFVKPDLDQLLAYQRDLSEYHLESRGKNIYPILVYTGANCAKDINNKKVNDKLNIYQICNKACICSPKNLKKECSDTKPIDWKRWVKSKYEPLPSILEAVCQYAKNEPLPEIRTANSAGIGKAFKIIKDNVKYAKDNHKFVVCFVSGVPGSGKTRLGLRLVYEEAEKTKDRAMYMSGNAALVEVLQYTLAQHKKDIKKDSEALIKELFNVINQDSIDMNVLVFDEGQRAWITDDGKINQPLTIMNKMEKGLDWGFLLVLYGDKQNIRDKEKASIDNWAKNLQPSWEVACPDNFAKYFPRNAIHHTYEQLNLTVCLRSHTAKDISELVNLIIAGDKEGAKKVRKNIDDSFPLYITHNRNIAIRYCRDRYKNDRRKYYGFLTSSLQMGKNWNEEGYCEGEVKYRQIANNRLNARKTVNRQDECGKWYTNNNTAGQSHSIGDFSRDFRSVANEFACQGLELDMPVVCWRHDMVWKEGKWNFLLKNPFRNSLRSNAYRILLTRGRDGLIIYIPDTDRLQETYNLFKDIGFEELDLLEQETTTKCS